MAFLKDKRRLVIWGLFVLLGAVCSFAAFRFYTPPPPQVPTARVEQRDFLTTVRTRGELKSTKSAVVTAPQTPNLTIVRLAEDGKPIKKGEVIVAFDAATQEERYTSQETEVRQVDSEILQAEAQHSIADEQNSMMIMQSEYNVERAKLEASKQEILSEIEGLKNRINVGVSEGELSKANTNAKATDLSQGADLARLVERKEKAIRDLDRTKGYLNSMVLRAPSDGVVHVLQNFRSGGSWGQARPPFQEGDTVWTGAPIIEVPDLNSLRVEFRIEEIDRGRIEVGQPVRVRVDAVPDAVIDGKLEWISPIATLIFRRFPPDKNFPAEASMHEIDPRLKPGMSARVEIEIERRPNVLVIPAKASFQIDGKPAVFLLTGNRYERRPIEVAARNSSEIVVSAGVEAGQVIALENPELAAAKKKF